jgi:tRNA-specific 2-thiouridylase
MRVVVAMSGGVDSSVTAALLKEEGWEVIGVTMQLWPSAESAAEAERFGGCCGLEAVTEAKTVAHRLGIPHYAMNFKPIFARKVIADFCREYSLGRTPNPCIRCNQYVKFDALLKKAKGLGADFVATGHYARIEYDKGSGRYLLKRGIDLKKDQSYVLYTMTQHQLRDTLMPLGHLTKEKVRQIAHELGLSVADKAESQDICFIPDDNYPSFFEQYMPGAAKPGPILDKRGNALGEHRGILFYTIGQRRGLGISAPEPLYVVAIDGRNNTIIVGSKEDTYQDELIAAEVNWIAIEPPGQPIKARVKVRYLHPGAEAIVTPLAEDKVQVKFEEPQMALTPGQAAVFYNGDSVIGGGTIG